jgi:hypothetical protein
MKRWSELTTPEQYLSHTGCEIDYYYITTYWKSNHYEPAGSEIYNTYNNLQEALTGLQKAKLDDIQ